MTADTKEVIIIAILMIIGGVLLGFGIGYSVRGSPTLEPQDARSSIELNVSGEGHRIVIGE